MAQDMPGETARDTGDDVLERLQTLVDDDDRKGPSIHRLAYAERLSAAYHEIEAAVTDVLDRPTWDDQTQGVGGRATAHDQPADLALRAHRRTCRPAPGVG